MDWAAAHRGVAVVSECAIIFGRTVGLCAAVTGANVARFMFRLNMVYPATSGLETKFCNERLAGCGRP